MRIGIVATRLGDVDGVSFEALKWQAVLNRLGHEVRLCAGALAVPRDGDALIPEMHFSHPDIAAVSAAALDPLSDPRSVRDEIEQLATTLASRLHDWLDSARLDAVIIQNAWAIPMHLPLGVALARVVGDRSLPAIGHHHDYWWERDRFATCVVPDVLERAFPPDLPHLAHVSINRLSAAELHRRRSLDSMVIPNVFDFDQPLRPGAREAAAALRTELGVSSEQLLVVQPTRVVRRKGIELAIELVARLDRPGTVLLITSPATDEGNGYLDEIRGLADRLGVDLRHEPDRFRSSTGPVPHGPAHSLSDGYLGADVITYPSLYEGFGNALVEAVYFRKLTVVNRYPVYESDIRPLGFRFIELAGSVTDDSVAQLRRALADPERRSRDAEHNFLIGREHLGYQRLERDLSALLDTVLAS